MNSFEVAYAIVLPALHEEDVHRLTHPVPSTHKFKDRLVMPRARRGSFVRGVPLLTAYSRSEYIHPDHERAPHRVKHVLVLLAPLAVVIERIDACVELHQVADAKPLHEVQHVLGPGWVAANVGAALVAVAAYIANGPLDVVSVPSKRQRGRVARDEEQSGGRRRMLHHPDVGVAGVDSWAVLRDKIDRRDDVGVEVDL
eukprot:scaffold48237_cov29-Tisochrysis_lutea.AAC.3